MNIISLPALFHDYVKAINADYISDIEELTLEQMQQVFLMALRDYYDYKLSVDGFSFIGNALWSSLEDRTTEHADAFYAAGELNYYVRNADKKHSETLTSFLTELKEYYQDYKHLLKDK